MPIPAAACFVGCLSISGIPPFNGFVSKTLIYHALDSAVLQVLFIAACAGTVASFIKLFGHTFLEWGPAQSTGKKSVQTLREIPLLMKLPLFVLSGVCLFLGVYPGYALPFVGYTEFVWNMSLAGECVLPLLCGILLYYIGLKTKVILNPPTFRITVDALFCTGGRAVEYFSTVLNKVLTQDLNYYITCLVIVLLAFLFWFYI
jgi:NADH:ubiquinone oxidoreductase subunit 5 (subunit L)/multisubunit Na+/H+ antiporter MnhA subunit